MASEKRKAYKFVGEGKMPTIKPKNNPTPKSNRLEKLVQDVTNRYRVTAREARDIVTAIGTAANAANEKQVKSSNKNLVKQVAEVGKAAITGKSGTTSDKATIKMYKNEPNVYTKGKKRK